MPLGSPRRLARHRRHAIAGQHQIDPRTLERALREGVDAIHGDAVRERVAAALADYEREAAEEQRRVG